MKRKTLRIAALIGTMMVAALVAVMFTKGSPAEAKLPEYVGSQACLGCHSDKYEAWQGTSHSVNTKQLMNAADFPADPSTAPAELKAELEKADYMWHGRRFLMQDPATGELKYLNVGWNPDKKVYEPYKGGGVWSQNCGGCHSGAVNEGVVKTTVEPGIGCEACHGPGRDHILGKGDVSKIVATTDSSAMCAQCHSGYNLAANSTRWAQGYRPGTKLENYSTFQFKEYDPAQPAPNMTEDRHFEEYPQWKASAHANAAKDLVAANGKDTCWKCHSSTAAALAREGQPTTAKDHDFSDGVSCVACHDPHSAANPSQLRMEPKQLCESCHTASLAAGAKFKPGAEVHHPNKEMLAGVGAPAVNDTKTFHSDLSCTECHMTQNNHEMKVVTPDQVIGTVRKDSCTSCHKDSSPETRGAYLNAWQESTEAKLTTLKADVAGIDTVLKANPNALSADLKAKYDVAKTNMSFVESDGSKGAHNFEYAMKLLSQAQSNIAAAKAGLGK